MRQYLALQLAALTIISAFFGFKAAHVVAASDFRETLAQLPGGELIVPRGVPGKADLANFEQVLNLLATDYLEPIDDKSKLIEGAIQGSVAALGDRYSRYVTKVDNPTLTEEISGHYGGIGVLIEQKDGHTLAATVFPEQPADRAGMAVGDIIVGVDGEDVTDLHVSEIVDRIKGPLDETVVLNVYRPTTQESLDLEITRASVKYPSVFKKEILPDTDGVGYIQLIVFNAESGPDFLATVDELRQAGMKSLILDLRQNTGGTFLAALQITDALVGGGPLVWTEDRSGQKKASEARDGGRALDLPLVILTDGFSASASEIVAGAVQDTRSGVLVGQKTFGKGVVQSVITLKDNSSLILTTARYLTPNARDINKHGIRPDIDVDIEALTEGDEFVESRIAKINALSAEAVTLRQELQEYFTDKDYALDEALSILNDPAAYAAVLAQPGPTPADDEAAWAEELAAAEKAKAEADGEESADSVMNAPIDALQDE